MSIAFNLTVSEVNHYQDENQTHRTVHEVASFALPEFRALRGHFMVKDGLLLDSGCEMLTKNEVINWLLPVVGRNWNCEGAFRYLGSLPEESRNFYFEFSVSWG